MTSVTFLFTDIEGSTRRWERDPAGMVGALERHDLLLRRAIEAHAGRVFKTFGDAFCAAFDMPASALSAALAPQRELLAERWPFPDGLPVRVALHAGQAEERDGDFFGLSVNRSARILAAGHGSQVLLSGAARDALAGCLPPGAELLPLGTWRLKDLEQPEELFQLLAPGLPAAFPPPRAIRVPAAAPSPAEAEGDDPAALLRDLGSLDYDRRRRAGEALLRRGPAARPLLLEALAAPRPELRKAAAEVLGNLGDPAAVSALSAALADRDEYVRQKAAEALGRIGDGAAVPALCEALLSGDRSLRWWAAEALGRIADPCALPILRQALQDPDRHVREKAVLALTRLGREAGPPVEEALSDPHPGVRRAALGALGSGSCASTGALVQALRHGDAGIRREAAEALGDPGPAGPDLRAVTALCGVLEDPDPVLRGAAARSLGRLRHSYAVYRLCRSLKDPDPSIRSLAAGALTELGAPAAPFLSQMLEEKDPDVRHRAARALVEMGEAAILPVSRMLKSGYPPARRLACETLTELAGRAPAPALRAALPDLRRLLAWSLDPVDTRRVYQAAVERIEAVTASLKSTPLPASAPVATWLPIPAESPDSADPA